MDGSAIKYLIYGFDSDITHSEQHSVLRWLATFLGSRDIERHFRPIESIAVEVLWSCNSLSRGEKFLEGH